jgi:Uma2 family endonuclease
MTVSNSSATVPPRPQRRYVRAPQPIRFPESAEVPETGVHLELRTALYLLVRDFVGERGAVGSEQFVYWDPSDPRQCLAPDLIVRMGAEPGPFPTWKTWERGAPHLAVEVVSVFDTGARVWERKLAHYRKSGILEVARFDPDDGRAPLRLWDRVEGDLVERELVGNDALLCDTLGVYWCVRPDAVLGRALRLSRDALGAELVPSLLEQQAALAEQQAALAEQQAALAEQQAARIAELEAELRRR